MAMVNDASVEEGIKALANWQDAGVVALAKKAVRALREYPTLRDETTKDGPPVFCLQGIGFGPLRSGTVPFPSDLIATNA
jgi:hypothetical protein